MTKSTCDATHTVCVCKLGSGRYVVGESVADPDERITVGFGGAYLARNHEVWWDSDRREYADCMTVAQAEACAALDPDHHWEIVLYGPLKGRVYRRQSDGRWLLVEMNEGFA